MAFGIQRGPLFLFLVRGTTALLLGRSWEKEDGDALVQQLAEAACCCGPAVNSPLAVPASRTAWPEGSAAQNPGNGAIYPARGCSLPWLCLWWQLVWQLKSLIRRYKPSFLFIAVNDGLIITKTANGDYRKEHRERSRSPIERAAAPTMSLHANHMYASIPSLSMEQPLALTKNSVDAARTVGISPSLSSVERQQVRRPQRLLLGQRGLKVKRCLCMTLRFILGSIKHCLRIKQGGCATDPTVPTTAACDPVVEEHFRRSLGKNYKEPEPVANSVSITGSVDDHFAKALGDTWLQIKAAKDGVGSSPESAARRGQASPSSHMPIHQPTPSRSIHSSSRFYTVKLFNLEKVQGRKIGRLALTLAFSRNPSRISNVDVHQVSSIPMALEMGNP
ncbi:hypothetical protein DV515_00013030 [Chloebia gouldiae]|uniref:Transcription cofactor vestigial-like protein 4 n=1 Tax=Chloebia gouldiae TaxID=44316 RepID=A0A3L8S266_CHLGU|nr:hypothetical protein DV515_00013030 [Chloebia gouldiae]